MNNEQAITEEERIQEELVAFLDGELPQEEVDRIDQRLREDVAYRQKLHQLQAAWDLLDALPRAQADESFTQSTVEMVTLTAEGEIHQRQATVQRRGLLGILSLAAVVIVAAGLSYFAVYQWLDQPNQQLVKDLPVIENVEKYRVADDVEFLRQLATSGLFEEEPSDAP